MMLPPPPFLPHHVCPMESHQEGVTDSEPPATSLPLLTVRTRQYFFGVVCRRGGVCRPAVATGGLREGQEPVRMSLLP